MQNPFHQILIQSNKAGHDAKSISPHQPASKVLSPTPIWYLQKDYPSVTQLSTGVQTEEVSIPHTTLKTDHNTDKNLGATRLVNNADLTVSAPTN